MNKKALLLCVFFIQLSFVFSQKNPFERRGNKVELQGNMTFAGNSIVTADDLNDRVNNEEREIRYINENFEGKETLSGKIYSASGYNLELPPCSKVKYAGLYWGGVKANSGDPVWLKIPRRNSPIKIDKQDEHFDEVNKVYVCYADVTKWVANQNEKEDVSGKYYVANIKTHTGKDPKGIGYFGGWVLVIIYENEEETNKKFYVYDGLLTVADKSRKFTYKNLDPVTKNGQIGVSFLTCTFDGDPADEADSYNAKLKNGFFEHIIDEKKEQVNKVNDFFNSSISRYGKSEEEAKRVIPENLKENYLGFDIDLVKIDNHNGRENRFFDKGDTSIEVEFEREGKRNTLGDITEKNVYFPFLNVIAIDAPAPNIELVTTVDNGDWVGKTDITLDNGQDIWYDIAFQNKGVEDAKDAEIKIVLDQNLEVIKKSDGTDDIEFKKSKTISQNFREPPSNNGNTYTFKIKDANVVAQDEVRHIRIHVKLKDNVIKGCDDASFKPSCDFPSIVSKVSATYKGKENGGTYNKKESDCNVAKIRIKQVECPPKNKVLCDGGTLKLTAKDNFGVYNWTKKDDTSFSQQGKEITISQAGTYIVEMKVRASCEASYKQTFNVTNFAEIQNPLKAFNPAKTKTCTIRGKEEEVLIFNLCFSDSITLEIKEGDEVVWHKHDDFNDCPSEPFTDVKIPHPNWDHYLFRDEFGNRIEEARKNRKQKIDEEGNYSLYLKQGECTKVFYFNIYKEKINPKIEHQNITCTKKGKIEVKGVPAGYKYAFKKVTSTEELKYQDENFIEVTEAGKYGIHIKKEGTDCIHSEAVTIKKEDGVTIELADKKDQKCPDGTPPEFTVKIIGGKEPYTFKLNNKETTPSSVNGKQYTFKNLTAGQIYKVIVKDSEGCLDELELQMDDVKDVDFSLELGRKYCEEVEFKLIEIGYNPTVKFYWYSEDNPTAKTLFDNSGIVRISSKGEGEKTYWAEAEIPGCDPKKVSIKVPLSNDKPTFEVDKSVKNRFIIKPSKGNPPYTILVDGEEIIGEYDNEKGGYIVPITATRDYMIKVIDNLGCESPLQKVHGIFFTFGVPNFFTPNNDGKNDTWGAYEVEDYNELEIFIYDRYGRNLTILKGRETWNGTYQGKKMPRGDYWYTMYYIERTKEKKKAIGHFTLYRK